MWGKVNQFARFPKLKRNRIPSPSFSYWCFGLPGNDEDNKIELNYLLKQDKRKQMAASYKHWQSKRKSIGKAFKPVTQQSSPLYTFTAGSIPQFVIKWKKLIKISSVHRTSLNVGSTGALSAYTTRLHVWRTKLKISHSFKQNFSKKPFDIPIDQY